VGYRLAAVLEVISTDPAGEKLPPTALVFGDEIGQSIASVKTAWRSACERAGVSDLRFHDLGREFACRLLESRAELHDVRDFLGHANITTTSRYLRSTTLRLERALTLLEEREQQHLSGNENGRTEQHSRTIATSLPHGRSDDPQTTKPIDPETIDFIEDVLVTLNFASWNRVVAWLKGIDELRRAA
jgi:hypothetical protein